MSKPKQLIFIDDSGDPGFKTQGGASRMFVIACVIFDDFREAELASAGIRELKKKLGWKQEREFKFHDVNERQKEIFFKTVKKYNFRIRAIVVDKTQITEPRLKKRESFYKFIILQVLERFDEMRDARVRLDGSGTKKFLRQSSAQFRKKLNRNGLHRMEDFDLEDSRRSVMIQLADMVVGSMRAKYDPGKKIKQDYLNIIKTKIEEIWEYES